MSLCAVATTPPEAIFIAPRKFAESDRKSTFLSFFASTIDIHFNEIECQRLLLSHLRIELSEGARQTTNIKRVTISDFRWRIMVGRVGKYYNTGFGLDRPHG